MTTLVVGGSGAIGTAVMVRLANERGQVHSLDRAEGVDATDPEEFDDFLGRLPSCPTNLVHVAGSVGVGGWAETGIDDWHRVLNDNLTSAFVACRALAPRIAEAGGAVVLTSSVNGRHGGNSLSGPAYAAAKAGVIALARNVAREYGPQGLRANVVAPGPVASQMTERLSSEDLSALLRSVPVGRIAQPDEVAAAICYLLSPDASYVNGAVLDLNGGMWMG